MAKWLKSDSPNLLTRGVVQCLYAVVGRFRIFILRTLVTLSRDQITSMYVLTHPTYPIELSRHFTVEFLVGERLEHLKRSHIALEADDLIPADVMLNTYGKQREHQVGLWL